MEGSPCYAAANLSPATAGAPSSNNLSCRQWTLASKVIRSMRMLMDSPVLLFMVRGEGARGRGRVMYIETRQRCAHRRRRISAVLPVPVSRCTSESLTVTLAARGPPPGATKTRENGMVGKPGNASGAR